MAMKFDKNITKYGARCKSCSMKYSVTISRNVGETILVGENDCWPSTIKPAILQYIFTIPSYIVLAQFEKHSH